MRLIANIGRWFDHRLHLAAPIQEAAEHPVPRKSASWFYVFGSAALTVFLLQLATGILLALVYVPSAAEAWNSLQALNHDVTLGWFIRALHGWGSNFMVAIVLIHMAQVFLFGAYKFPRELTWILGVFLLLMTLGMAFTGQVLRFDQDAYWGLGIGASIMGRVPGIGANIVHLMLAGPIIAGETLSRFFTLHVFIIPGLIIALVSLHLRLVLMKGINEYPVPGKPVDKQTYEREYEELVANKGVPFVPKAIGKDLVFSGLVLLGILICSVYFGPMGPEGSPDPTQIRTVPRPDFFFLWIFSVLALLPAYLETILILSAPIIGVILLFALPFLSGTGEKSYRRRPLAVLSVVVFFLALGILTYMGTYSPWSPQMDAWSGDPVPVKFIEGRTPLEHSGALVFQNKQCRNCHSLGGLGGERGPALDDVATIMTSDQLVRQVIQGGGNMPAFGKNLSPPEVTALVAFMRTLRGPNESPARDSAQPAQPAR